MEERYGSPRISAGVSHSPRSLQSPRSPRPSPAQSPGPIPTVHRGSNMPGTSEYTQYPPAQPFINDDYRRDTSKPMLAYPESHRQGVMSALKGLQEKIRRLESERTVAEDNLQSLATETARYQDIMQAGPDASQLSQASGAPGNMGNVSQQAHDIHGKLEVAEHRCELLEKQLDYMRRMVQGAESDRTGAARRALLLEKQREDEEREAYMNKLNKISKLERDHLKLTATQTLAENRIRDLEEKLRLEREHRKIIQERTAEWETAAQTDRILREATGQNLSQKPKKKKKKKKVAVTDTCKCPPRKSGRHAGKEPAEQYKLNLGDIPFIAGKSTAPSHHLAANFQEVLYLMKNHNQKLCPSPRSHMRSGYKYLNHQGSAGSGSGSRSGSGSGLGSAGSSSAENDLTDLLLQLQDEFGHLSFEHQELSRQLQDATDPGLMEDLERELDHIVSRMESKGQQIARLRRHHELTSIGKRKKKSRSSSSQPRPKSAMAALPSQVNGEVEVTTTVRTKGKGVGSVVLSPTSGNRAQASLNLFKDLKKIQTSLRKDDITWEC